MERYNVAVIVVTEEIYNTVTIGFRLRALVVSVLDVGVWDVTSLRDIMLWFISELQVVFLFPIILDIQFIDFFLSVVCCLIEWMMELYDWENGFY